jgi:hypothetical protein
VPDGCGGDEFGLVGRRPADLARLRQLDMFRHGTVPFRPLPAARIAAGRKESRGTRRRDGGDLANTWLFGRAEPDVIAPPEADPTIRNGRLPRIAAAH